MVKLHHLFLVLLVTIFISSPLTAKKQFVTIGTASISGVYYPIGSALCKILNKTEPDILCSVQSTPGSIYNINSLRNGDIDLGVAQADSEYNAYNSVGIFSRVKPMHNLRTVFLMHHDVFTIVVRKDSNIKSINDIRNKRVNIGAPGTGVRDSTQQLMKIKNWSTSDFKLASELKSSEQAQALCDNKIDVMIDVVGHPNAGVQEASATCDVTLISVDRGTIEQLKNKYPYYTDYTIPAGQYNGTDENIETFAVRTSVVSTKETSNEIIYKLVKSMFENFEKFKHAHSLFASFTKQNIVGKNTAPLHEGAIKYYKEVGLL